ncbi:MAG: hypothetical protein [Bacteriophage sp.]|nr:MAG: hypothetical protein [Bacteriophage sp.]
MVTRYGLPKIVMEYHRALLDVGYPHDYVMMQLAQTYRTRKAMYRFTCHYCGRHYTEGPAICTSDDCPSKDLAR